MSLIISLAVWKKILHIITYKYNVRSDNWPGLLQGGGICGWEARRSGAVWPGQHWGVSSPSLHPARTQSPLLQNKSTCTYILHLIYTQLKKKNPSFYKINSRCPTKESKAVNTCRRKDFHTKVTNCDLIVFLLNNLGMTSTMWLMRRSRHCIRYSTLSDPLFSAALPSRGVWRRLSLSMYMTSL